MFLPGFNRRLPFIITLWGAFVPCKPARRFELFEGERLESRATRFGWGPFSGKRESWSVLLKIEKMGSLPNPVVGNQPLAIWFLKGGSVGSLLYR